MTASASLSKFSRWNIPDRTVHWSGQLLISLNCVFDASLVPETCLEFPFLPVRSRDSIRQAKADMRHGASCPTISMAPVSRLRPKLLRHRMLRGAGRGVCLHLRVERAGRESTNSLMFFRVAEDAGNRVFSSRTVRRR